MSSGSFSRPLQRDRSYDLLGTNYRLNLRPNKRETLMKKVDLCYERLFFSSDSVYVPLITLFDKYYEDIVSPDLTSYYDRYRRSNYEWDVRKIDVELRGFRIMNNKYTVGNYCVLDTTTEDWFPVLMMVFKREYNKLFNDLIKSDNSDIINENINNHTNLLELWINGSVDRKIMRYFIKPIERRLRHHNIKMVVKSTEDFVKGISPAIEFPKFTSISERTRFLRNVGNNALQEFSER